MLRPGLDFEIPTVEILEKYLEAKWESEFRAEKKGICFFSFVRQAFNLESFGRRSNSKVLLSNSSNPSFVDLIWFFVHWRCRGLWEPCASKHPIYVLTSLSLSLYIYVYIYIHMNTVCIRYSLKTSEKDRVLWSVNNSSLKLPSSAGQRFLSSTSCIEIHWKGTTFSPSLYPVFECSLAGNKCLQPNKLKFNKGLIWTVMKHPCPWRPSWTPYFW